jgi:hypothetical protein
MASKERGEMELWMSSQQAWGDVVDRQNKKTLGVGGSDYGHAVWACVVVIRTENITVCFNIDK